MLNIVKKVKDIMKVTKSILFQTCLFLGWKNFLIAKTIPYCIIAVKMGTWVPMNHVSIRLKPLREGASTAL